MPIAFIPATPLSHHPLRRATLQTTRPRPLAPSPPARRARHVPLATMSAAPLKPLVPILMGSGSDMKYCSKIADALTALGIDSELRIASAHKIPARLLSVIEAYEACPRPKLYIAVAGRSNALSGMLDCAVTAPVISCPPYSDTFGGADLFSSIRMPSGVAPALVLEPAGAALLAAKTLGVYDPQVRQSVATLQKANRDRLFIDDALSVTKTYAPQIAAVREAAQTMVETTPSLVFASAAAATVSAVRNGKVRDQYDFVGNDNAGNEKANLVALVTTDRQSAFDRVLAAIPFKGAVLNQTAAWWFENTRHIIPNHVVSVPHPNVTIARRCKPFPVEFVVRGYITGSTDTSLWKNYSNGVRNYCGIDFPEGLAKNQKLDANVLTPTTKEDAGDRPIAPKDVVAEGLMSQADWDTCAKAAMSLFEYGQKVAGDNGLILVDTKYEFGRDDDGTIRLIDEVHTPDSSRYWLSTSYKARTSKGEEPENIDKEFLRLWFRDNCDPYDKSKELPDAPADLVDELSRRYIMLYELITGQSFDFSAESGPSAIASSVDAFVASFAGASR
ncbi:fusion protein of phosphoribosylaminoimidazole carboxylase and phosphoribosylaminoimidazole-succinocarboxamide synthase, chloroplast or mitochondrial precursor [Chondrus crispus]|uniref:SAICAR synthetase n=1 Tax=Chondrus crispus TaxID=2769 RepID=R7QFE3_CHOCR|nr:fusion protein of phosphoribosylaminoimidazole carboxylase and phosphoribosylaminoimidazole-succinocarboxamide synthase, chloroplast or mitochondrial precursor [Chondrus crispus]CDF36166.1 fusion protein of phosphoribosylaminoimidazole carboxylase and phosphoribosylaminoimidazole-succinocarboxamide synthase, chloroplast or mitochondrial precursor [Chondrus crispus]|eukprot:XP_005715985.1 fusion protein of phosphoribosylaminoimidazole carboxylase and phosphoribosylaminoimidazole-succinocarboxamide synthase, chloroplast or mitochondrial precursor [Chondrus crispus]